MLRPTVVNWNKQHAGPYVSVCGGEAEIIAILSSEVTDSSLRFPVSVRAASIGNTTAGERADEKGLLWIHYFCESLAINSLDLVKENQ